MSWVPLEIWGTCLENFRLLAMFFVLYKCFFVTAWLLARGYVAVLGRVAALNLKDLYSVMGAMARCHLACKMLKYQHTVAVRSACGCALFVTRLAALCGLAQFLV